MKVKTGYFQSATPEGPMAIYFAHPRDHKESLPVILVLQEAFGVNGHIQDICHRFAHEGFLAVAPELFHRIGEHEQIDYGDKPKVMSYLKRLSEETLSMDIRATLESLAQFPFADRERIAAVGFCMGGYSAILAATEFPITTAIAFYGAGLVRPREGIGFGPLIERFPSIKCPLLFFFGEDDASIPLGDIEAMEEALDKADVSYRCVMFKNSNHGFFCNQRGSYNPEAAKEAWRLTLEWLENQLTDLSMGISEVPPPMP